MRTADLMLFAAALPHSSTHTRGAAGRSCHSIPIYTIERSNSISIHFVRFILWTSMRCEHTCCYQCFLTMFRCWYLKTKTKKDNLLAVRYWLRSHQIDCPSVSSFGATSFDLSEIEGKLTGWKWAYNLYYEQELAGLDSILIAIRWNRMFFCVVVGSSS